MTNATLPKFVAIVIRNDTSPNFAKRRKLIMQKARVIVLLKRRMIPQEVVPTTPILVTEEVRNKRSNKEKATVNKCFSYM